MITRRLLAIIAMITLGSTGVAAQHGPEPKAHAEKAADVKAADGKTADVKAAEAKAPEAKAPDTRRGASASPLQTAAAIEQILRKLRQEGANAPARRPSREAARPRLRLAWRLTLQWPSALTDPPTP